MIIIFCYVIKDLIYNKKIGKREKNVFVCLKVYVCLSAEAQKLSFSNLALSGAFWHFHVQKKEKLKK
jgi:hypothetical protein